MEVRTAQVGMAKVCPAEIRSNQRGAGKARFAEVRVVKECVSEVASPREVRLMQVRSV